MLDPLHDPLKGSVVVPQKYVDALKEQGWVKVVRCKDCKHKRLDEPSLTTSIVKEFYCDARGEWRYQYIGEPDVLEWFCADGKANEGGDYNATQTD